MLKVIQSPSKYIQGANALQSIGEFAKLLADKYFIIADDFVMNLTVDTVGTSLKTNKLENHFSRFNGECSRQEIDRLTVELKKHGCNGVIGIGGGKTLDTAKAIAHYQHIPVVVVPTIASTDAHNQCTIGDLYRGRRVCRIPDLSGKPRYRADGFGDYR